MTGKCLFHEDDTASLVATPAKNLWHCFGCGAAGGRIDWTMRKNGVSFRHAVELLRDGVFPFPQPSHLGTRAADSGSVKRSIVHALYAPVAFDADDHAAQPGGRAITSRVRGTAPKSARWSSASPFTSCW